MTATDLPASLIPTPSAQYHTDAAIFSLEQTRVFATMWFCAVRSADRTIVECDWLYTREVVESGKDVPRSVELFHRVDEQDFAACERTRPAMSSRAHARGGVLVPSGHHMAPPTTG